MHLTDDPHVRRDAGLAAPFIIAMCLYAGGILSGELPGPYRDEDASAFARDALIPRELLEAPHRVDPEETARWLGMPAREVRHALRESQRERAKAKSLRHRCARLAAWWTSERSGH
jgi:hypothetical protein